MSFQRGGRVVDECQDSSHARPAANLRDDAAARRSSPNLVTTTFEAVVTAEVNRRLGGFVPWFRWYLTDAELARSRLGGAGRQVYHF